MKLNVRGKINLLSLNELIKRHRSVWSLVCLVLLFSGCAKYGNPIGRTEANYANIPVEALTNAALYLEKQVKEGNRTPDLALIDDFVLDSPAVKQALRSRAARIELVQILLDSGHAYEKRNGLIAIHRTKAYKKSGTYQSRDRDALVVISENNDRRMLYSSIQEINNLNPADRTAIENIFFEVHKQTLEVGQRFENTDGEIVTIK